MARQADDPGRRGHGNGLEPATPRTAALQLLNAGAVAQAAAVVELALTVTRSDPQERALRALRAELHYQAGEPRAARALVEELLSKGSEDDASLDARQTWAKLALASADFALARERYQAYLDAAERADDTRHRALAWGGLGVCAIRRDERDHARACLERAQTLAEACCDPKARALAATNLAVLEHGNHRWTSAAAAYGAALDALGELGNRPSMARAAFNLGELYESIGDLDSARRMCRLGEGVAGPDAPPATRAMGLLLRGRVALDERAFGEASLAFETAETLLRNVDVERLAAAQLGRARALLGLGSTTRAERLLSALPDGLSRPRAAEAALARVEWSRRAGADSLGAAQRALAAAEHAAAPLVIVAATAALARAESEAGQRANARVTARRGLELDRQLATRVPEASRGAFESRAERRRLERLAAGRHRRSGGQPHSLVGPSLEPVRALIARLAPSACFVVVRGESGTGKELVADRLWRASTRRDAPLLRLDCGAVSDGLIESTLFGHERGAFTDAIMRREGLFERAHGGTLLLDGIDGASPRLQAALVQAANTGRVRRVGSAQSQEVDVRLIATTRQDLRALVREGRFREDLLYRLEGARIELPPLRDRPLDLPALVDALLARHASAEDATPKTCSEEALRVLSRHNWPGNVRELDNVLRAASLFAEGECLDADAIGSILPGATPAAAGALDERDLCYRWLREEGLPLRSLKKEIERACVMRAMEESGGTISRAAALLGMKRPRLSQLVKEYRLGAEGEGR